MKHFNDIKLGGGFGTIADRALEAYDIAQRLGLTTKFDHNEVEIKIEPYWSEEAMMSHVVRQYAKDHLIKFNY